MADVSARFAPWGTPARTDPGLALPAAMFPAVRRGVLPFGAGRSSGDCCVRTGGALLDSRPYARIRSFNPKTGRLTADAGVSLGALMHHVAPHHVLPVVPETAHATLGGAIATDLHGTNHLRRGSFGAWVEGIWLRRSDQPRRVHLLPGDPLFAATLGGLGMTGLIEFATIRCLPVAADAVTRRSLHVADLGAALEQLAEAAQTHEYAKVWLDTLGTGRALGRGVLTVGDHAAAAATASGSTLAGRARALQQVSAVPGLPVLNDVGVRAFSLIKRRRIPRRGLTETVSAERALFGIDVLNGWTRLHGARGLHIHQSVLPTEVAPLAIAAMLRLTKASCHPSINATLCRLGESRSQSVMGFARPGIALTLDLAAKGASTATLLDGLDAIAIDAGGAVNPGLDRRMSPATFERSLPRWTTVEGMRDPAIVSDLWRRTAFLLRQADAVEAQEAA